MKQLVLALIVLFGGIACAITRMPHAGPATIPTPPASMTPASMEPEHDAVRPAVLSSPIAELPAQAGPDAVAELAVDDSAVVFNSPTCATCAPPQQPRYQPANNGPRYQRRGLFGGRFRR